MAEVPGQARRPGGPVSPALAALHDTLTQMVAESQQLSRDVRTAEEARRSAERATRRTGMITMVLVGLVVVLLAALLTIGWQNNRLAHSVKRTNDRVADCTTAGGRCYEESRQRTSAAVADLTRASVYVVECSRLYPGESGPEYDRKLEACVADRLTADAARRSGK